MPNALTLDDMSPRLRKVVGRESPRVTSTEEPDGGNLLVRIWRGAGMGNLPAYSTTVFLSGVCGSAPPELPPPGRRIASWYRFFPPRLLSVEIFYLYTAHMCSIVKHISGHLPPLDAVRRVLAWHQLLPPMNPGTPVTPCSIP